MDRERLLQFLVDLDSDVWLDLLSEAFDIMDSDQRDEIFGWFYEAIGSDEDALDDDEDDAPPEPPGATTLREVEALLTESYERLMPNGSGRRRRPVGPRDSAEWFSRFSRLTGEAMALSEAGEHVHAVACFGHLEVLLEAFERDELPLQDQGLGVEILSVDLKRTSRAYVHSLAETCDPQEFAEMIRPLVERDTITHTRALNAAILELASEEQRDALNQAQREALLSR